MEYLYNDAEFENLLTQLELNTDLAFEALDYATTLSILIDEPDTPQNRMGKEIIKDKLNNLFNAEVVVSMEALTIQDAKDFGRRALRAISDFVNRIIKWIRGLFKKTTEKSEAAIKEASDGLTQFREDARISDEAIKKYDIPVGEKLSQEMEKFFKEQKIEIMVDGEGNVHYSDYFFEDMTRRIVKNRVKAGMFGPISKNGDLEPILEIISRQVDQLSLLSSFGYPEPLLTYVQRLFSVQSQDDIPYLRDERVNENSTWVNQTISRLGLKKSKGKIYTGPIFNGRAFTLFTLDRIGKVPILNMDVSGKPNVRDEKIIPFGGSVKHARRPIEDIEKMIKYQIDLLAIQKRIEQDQLRFTEVMDRLYVNGRGESIAIARAKIEEVIEPVNPELARELVMELKVSHTRLSRVLSTYRKLIEYIEILTGACEYYFILLVGRDNNKFS